MLRVHKLRNVDVALKAGNRQKLALRVLFLFFNASLCLFSILLTVSPSPKSHSCAHLHQKQIASLALLLQLPSKGVFHTFVDFKMSHILWFTLDNYLYFLITYAYEIDLIYVFIVHFGIKSTMTIIQVRYLDLV